MEMEQRFDRPPQKPTTDPEAQPPQMAATTHKPDNIDKQTTTGGDSTLIMEILSLTKDRLAYLQRHKTLVPLYIITLAGIGSLLGQTITSLASGSSQIIRALGAGIRDTFHGVGDLDESVVGSISNATANVITAGTTGISKVLDAIGGPSGIILYILVVILYVYIIYNRVKDSPPLTMNLGFGSKPSKKGDLESPHLIKEEEFSEEDTKPLDPNSKVFRPMTRGSRLNTNEVWNPRGRVDPTPL